VFESLTKTRYDSPLVNMICVRTASDAVCYTIVYNTYS